LGKTDIITFQRKCFGNLSVNKQNQTMNENFLIEMQMRKIVPGKLIVFAKQDKHNRLAIKTNGIFPWNTNIENFLWNNLGKLMLMVTIDFMCVKFKFFPIKRLE
jgi:hypothetical protein